MDPVDISQIQAETKAIEKENIRILDNILTTAKESRRVAADTMIRLHEDDDRLDTIQQDLVTNKANLITANSKLKKIDSCLPNPLHWIKKRIAKSKLKKERRTLANAKANRTNKAAKYPVKKFINNSNATNHDDIISKKLDEVSILVDDLKLMSIEMGHTLDNQNGLLTVIIEEVDNQNYTTRKTTNKIREML